jgi:hypothetical protein
MRFAVNRYSVDFHVIAQDGAPLAGAILETHAFGIPPFELREICPSSVPAAEPFGAFDEWSTETDQERYRKL